MELEKQGDEADKSSASKTIHLLPSIQTNHVENFPTWHIIRFINDYITNRSLNVEKIRRLPYPYPKVTEPALSFAIMPWASDNGVQVSLVTLLLPAPLATPLVLLPPEDPKSSTC